MQKPRTWGIGGWIWSMCMKGCLFSITVRCCVIFTASSEPMQRCPLPNLLMREWTACKSHCLLSPASPTLLLALRPSDLAHLQTSIFSCDSIDEVLQRKEEACERVSVSERGEEVIPRQTTVMIKFSKFFSWSLFSSLWAVSVAPLNTAAWLRVNQAISITLHGNSQALRWDAVY